MREPTEAELRQELFRDPDNRSLTEWSIQCRLSDERYRKQLTESWKALNFPRKFNYELAYQSRPSSQNGPSGSPSEPSPTPYYGRDRTYVTYRSGKTEKELDASRLSDRDYLWEYGEHKPCREW